MRALTAPQGAPLRTRTVTVAAGDGSACWPDSLSRRGLLRWEATCCCHHLGRQAGQQPLGRRGPRAGGDHRFHHDAEHHRAIECLRQIHRHHHRRLGERHVQLRRGFVTGPGGQHLCGRQLGQREDWLHRRSRASVRVQELPGPLHRRRQGARIRRELRKPDGGERHEDLPVHEGRSPCAVGDDQEGQVHAAARSSGRSPDGSSGPDAGTWAGASPSRRWSRGTGPTCRGKDREEGSLRLEVQAQRVHVEIRLLRQRHHEAERVGRVQDTSPRRKASAAVDPRSVVS